MTGWEDALVGSVLANPNAMAECMDLKPSDFTGINQVLWSEMLVLYNRSGLDARSAIEAVRSSPDISRFPDVAQHVAAALEKRGTAINEYASQVLNASIRRGISRSAALIAAESNNNLRTTEELLEYAEKEILNLRRNRVNQGMDMTDLFSAYIPRLMGLRDSSFIPKFVPTLTATKELLPYLEDTDYFTVAARPGEGKSSYLRFEAYHHARQGKRCMIFNLENDPMEYARHFIALETGINNDLLKEPRRLSQEQLEAIKRAAESLSKLPLVIISLSSPSVSQLITTARRKAAEERPALIIIDYVQLIRNGNENRVEDLSDTTAKLKGLTVELQTPIMQAAQLSRGIEKRGDNADPRLDDLRESGSLEQDSTIVAFLRAENPTPGQLAEFPENVRNGTLIQTPVSIPIKLHVCKNRNGKTGKSGRVKWRKDIGRYETLTNS